MKYQRSIHKERVWRVMDRADRVIAEARARLLSRGIDYALHRWLTPERYAAQYGLASGTVTDWIESGRIPTRDVRE